MEQMNLHTAREINSAVANWYLQTRVFGRRSPVPMYSKERMLEAFSIVDRANKLRPVHEDGSQTFHAVCDPRIADMVIRSQRRSG